MRSAAARRPERDHVMGVPKQAFVGRRSFGGVESSLQLSGALGEGSGLHKRTRDGAGQVLALEIKRLVPCPYCTSVVGYQNERVGLPRPLYFHRYRPSRARLNYIRGIKRSMWLPGRRPWLHRPDPLCSGLSPCSPTQSTNRASVRSPDGTGILRQRYLHRPSVFFRGK